MIAEHWGRTAVLGASHALAAPGEEGWWELFVWMRVSPGEMSCLGTLGHLIVPPSGISRPPLCASLTMEARLWPVAMCSSVSPPRLGLDVTLWQKMSSERNQRLQDGQTIDRLRPTGPPIGQTWAFVTARDLQRLLTQMLMWQQSLMLCYDKIRHVQWESRIKGQRWYQYQAGETTKRTINKNMGTNRKKKKVASQILHLSVNSVNVFLNFRFSENALWQIYAMLCACLTVLWIKNPKIMTWMIWFEEFDQF